MDFITLCVLAFFGIVCFFLAKARGRNPWLWALLGFFFHVFSLILLFFLPRGDLEDELLALKGKVRVLETQKDLDAPKMKIQ